MINIENQVRKLSHKQFRAILKKYRRKKIRQQIAKERDHLQLLEKQIKENSPNYKEREAERQRNSDLYDQFEERERLRNCKAWLLREEQAQTEFRKKQEMRKQEEIRLEIERKRILEEFEKQKLLDNETERESLKLKTQKEVLISDIYEYLWEALQEALLNLQEGDGPWHNPIAPANYNPGQEREQCHFFAKTGCCRFGERCSRGHVYPSISTTILIKGMYSHFSIDQASRDDYDTDIALEYEDKETYQDFKNFYFDVLPEFKKFGKVLQFKVCNNHEPHLRGNVYIQYSKEEAAVEAYKNFNGRFYAGRQITCEFTNVIKWRSAICGLYFRNLCPKGLNCNFLHVFRNPSDEFWNADRDMSLQPHSRNSSKSHHSRSYSVRYNDSQRRQRSRTPEYRGSSSHREKSASELDDENESWNSQRKMSVSPSYSRHKKKRRSSTDSSDNGYHKKSKHKHKKKSKKHKKKKRASNEND